jgi:ribosomal-protein-alanine N-acetyltransferase
VQPELTVVEPRTGFAIRPVTRDDLASLLKIEKNVTPFPWSARQFSDSIGSHVAYALLRGSRMIGYLFYQQVIDQAELLNIAVKPSFQGEGHGTYLLDLCIDMLDDSVKHLYLEVRASNVSAIELYLKKGFIHTGRRAAYYHTENAREDALLMTYSFNQD